MTPWQAGLARGPCQKLADTTYRDAHQGGLEEERRVNDFGNGVHQVIFAITTVVQSFSRTAKPGAVGGARRVKRA